MPGLCWITCSPNNNFLGYLNQNNKFFSPRIYLNMFIYTCMKFCSENQSRYTFEYPKTRKIYFWPSFDNFWVQRNTKYTFIYIWNKGKSKVYLYDDPWQANIPSDSFRFFFKDINHQWYIPTAKAKVEQTVMYPDFFFDSTGFFPG